MECPICFEVPRKIKNWNPCHHMICNSCFKIWYLKNHKKNCPLCRHKYKKMYFDNFYFTKFYIYDAWKNSIII